MGDRRKPIPEVVQRRLTKFFVTNLPDRCSGMDLAGAIREYGAIFYIYIAKKRDKGGRRFGFFSFYDVKDKDELIKKMSNIRKNDTQNKTLILDDNASVFDDLQGRSLVLKLASFEVLRNIRKEMKDMGLAGGSIQYLGRLRLLVSFDSNEQAIMAKDEFLSRNNVFETVAIWEGQEITYERLAWVKVHGLPLHLLSNVNIDNVAKLFGKVVHNAQLECNDVDISYCYVGLLVNCGDMIHGEVSVMWRDKLIPVWVNEESGAWVPDFLNYDDKSSGTPMSSDDGSSTPDSMDSSSDSSHSIPEKMDDDDVTTPVVHASETIKEGINSPIMGSGIPGSDSMKDCQLPNITNDFNDEFSVDIGKVDNDNCLINKNKRKKNRGIVEMGQDSGSYKSSNERPTKESRLEVDDPFGLAPFILGSSVTTKRVNQECSVQAEIETEIAADAEEAARYDGSTAVHVVDDVQADIEAEVDETTKMGIKVGAKLHDFKELVRDSIEQEALQTGFK
ncbi:nucleotide-binding alpha-beta plait domain-containing protein [Artemisia annua]|uniref:Nucleotide-binding alpha-beta plait domain-containing protein n=1 Tax=Artemisia annua TaxID=35608 RepID=A0A2U1MDV7_ARTAN|nr:nucleotide-binding alpha-beta plait domain-containing protein [Artemisia annua]